MCIFCPLTKTFIVEESRPLIVPHEYIQIVKVSILEFIQSTKDNHKFFNLIQNTPHEFSIGTEVLKTTKALQLLWPLLHTKNIIRMLAKLLTTSDAIHDIFAHEFFPDGWVSMNLIILKLTNSKKTNHSLLDVFSFSLV